MGESTHLFLSQSDTLEVRMRVEQDAKGAQ